MDNKILTKEEKRFLVRQRYYEKHREQILMIKAKKVQCPCGSIVGHTHLARHERTKKHQKYLLSIK